MLSSNHQTHRWFSGKISRCQARSATNIVCSPVSASPGFDSRPMHFGLSDDLELRVVVFFCSCEPWTPGGRGV